MADDLPQLSDVLRRLDQELTRRLAWSGTQVGGVGLSVGCGTNPIAAEQ